MLPACAKRPATAGNARPTIAAMNILLNGHPHEWRPDGSVADLLASLGLADRRVAVEVDREIVPKSQHASRTLNDGQSIEIVHALGGG